MLKSCRFSTVGLQLLLLTHFANTFVLLTANIEDVKKIARKFVSDNIAEKIVSFLAKATESMAQNTNDSLDDEDSNTQDEVSAENKKYKVERHVFDDVGDEAIKSKKEIVSDKEKDRIPKSSIDKRGHDNEDHETEKTTSKSTTFVESKSVKERSRFVIKSKSDKKASLATEETVTEKTEGEKEYVKYFETLLINSSEKTKAKRLKEKTKGGSFKHLYSSKSVNNATKEIKRAMGSKTVKLSELEPHENYNEKPAHELNDHEIGESLHQTEKDEIDQLKNQLQNIETSDALSKVSQKDIKVDNWWEKELPTESINYDVNVRKKSWF